MQPGLPMRDVVRCCADGKGTEYWQELIHRTRKLIGATVFRVARGWGELRPDVLEDLIQEVYVHFLANDCRLLRECQALDEPAIFSFLKVATANLIHDRFRSQNAQKRGAGMSTAIDSDTELARAISDSDPVAMEKRVLVSEIERHLNQVTSGPDASKQRAVFWLYYRQGMSAKEISTIPSVGLSLKGVESLILRLTRAIRGRTSDPVSAPASSSMTNAKGVPEL